MIDAVNANAREFDGRRRYPTMFGKQGWYGWKDEPWKVGALELWYLSMRADDRARLEDNGWLAFLAGRNPSYPETALEAEVASLIVSALNLEVAAGEVDPVAPLYGEGLGLDSIDILVTDSGLSAEWRDRIASSGTELVIAAAPTHASPGPSPSSERRR